MQGWSLCNSFDTTLAATIYPLRHRWTPLVLCEIPMLKGVAIQLYSRCGTIIRTLKSALRASSFWRCCIVDKSSRLWFSLSQYCRIYGTIIFHGPIAVHAIECILCGDWFLRSQGLSTAFWRLARFVHRETILGVSVIVRGLTYYALISTSSDELGTSWCVV